MRMPAIQFAGGWAVLFAVNAFAAAPVSLQLHTDSDAEAKTNVVVRLRGADGRQRLRGTAELDSGMVGDVTRHVTDETAPPDVVKVTGGGVVIPLKDGTTTVSARTTNGLASTLSVAVERYADVPLINFAN